MPVHVDLGQFPRLQCRRCGLVALVDPDLPLDARASVTCPVCTRPLMAPRLPQPRVAGPVPVRAGAHPGATPMGQPHERRRLATGAPRRGAREPIGPVPSHVAVSLALVALAVLLLLCMFVWLLLTPHQSFWWALTR
jgi:hypothetical protein